MGAGGRLLSPSPGTYLQSAAVRREWGLSRGSLRGSIKTWAGDCEGVRSGCCHVLVRDHIPKAQVCGGKSMG